MHIELGSLLDFIAKESPQAKVDLEFVHRYVEQMTAEKLTALLQADVKIKCDRHVVG